MMCHQANDFQVTEAEWQRLRAQIDRFHADGRCVIFVGYEWSGMTPGGGDRNVMFRGDAAALHRSSHAEVDDMSDAATDCFPVTELFAQFHVTIHVPRRPYVQTLRGIPTIRVFEALACGIPLVSAPWKDIEGLFPSGSYLTASDTTEMTASLSRVLNDNELAADLSRTGLAAIRARHTCAHRAREHLEIAGELGAPAMRMMKLSAEDERVSLP